MTVEDKERSRQKQSWLTWLLIVIMIALISFLYLKDKGIEPLADFFTFVIGLLLGHETGNKFSTPRGR